MNITADFSFLTLLAMWPLTAKRPTYLHHHPTRLNPNLPLYSPTSLILDRFLKSSLSWGRIYPTSLNPCSAKWVFRIPLDYFASPRHLTTITIPLAHKMTILEAQIEVAVELGRNISMHSVKSQQATLELLYQIRRSQVTDLSLMKSHSGHTKNHQKSQKRVQK